MSSLHLQGLPEKDRKPATVKVLSQWIRHAADLAGETHSRVEWIVISTIVIAALQRASGPDGAPLFLLKGGVYLEHRLGLESRATKDVDTLFRGSLDDFLVKLDEALAEPWDGLDLRRTEIEKIENTARIVAPRRFNVIVSMKGRTFRKIQVEVAFPEGDIDKHVDMSWPPRIETNELWEVEFPRPASEVGLQIGLAQALAEVTEWVTAIAGSDLGDEAA